MSSLTVNTFLILACMVYSCSMLTLPLTGGQPNLLANSTAHTKANHAVDNTVANPSCGQVRSFFIGQQIAPEEQLPQSTITDANLSVCESRETCCTPSMETALQTSASRNFGHALRVSSDHLRASLTDAAASIQGQIVHHIKGSMTKTQTMFTHLYKRVALLAREPIVNLFTELERFILGKEEDQSNVDVAASVARFFGDLFPRLYGQSPSSVQGPPVIAGRTTVRDLSPDYVECLRKAQAELRPFGEIPRRLASSLARTLDAAKALLSSLQLGVQVLNATDHMEMNGECSAALLRASYCAQCRGYSSVKLCRGLCSNVVRGCLAGVADVDQPWNEWVEAMERLTNAIMNGDLGTHDILSSIDSRLSEAVLNALENGPILEKKVKRICGEVTNSTKDGASSQDGILVADETVLEDTKDLSVIQNDSALGDLTSRLQTLHPILTVARGFYANLPDAVCSTKNSPFASEEDTHCWNGQRLGEYTKPISGIGIGAQKYNAEVKVSRSDLDPNLLQLSDQLRHVRQVLISKTVVAPEPDSLVMADFGSGSGDGGLSKGSVWMTDDSERGNVDEHHGSFDDGSGSGSGPYKPPLFDDQGSSTETTVETTTTQSSAPESSSRLTSAITIILSLALVLSARQFA